MMAFSSDKELASINKLIYSANPRVLGKYCTPPNYLATNKGK